MSLSVISHPESIARYVSGECPHCGGPPVRLDPAVFIDPVRVIEARPAIWSCSNGHSWTMPDA